MDEFAEWRKRAAQVDAQVFLGHLVSYKVSDVRIPHHEMVRKMLKVGLGANLPPEPRDDDVFARISKKAERRKIPTANPSEFENILVRNVGRDADTILRRLVVERVDPSGKRLSYTQLMDLSFDRKTSKITPEWINHGFSAPVDSAAEEIMVGFEQWKGCMHSYTVREWVRHFILGLGATRWRDGVYFVRQENFPTISKLEKLVKGLGDSCEFDSLPLIDDSKRRDMIRRAFEAETQDEVDKMMADLQGVIDEGNASLSSGHDAGIITSDRYAAIVTRFQELGERTEEYEGLLEAGLRSTKSRLKLFQRSILEVGQFVKD